MKGNKEVREIQEGEDTGGKKRLEREEGGEEGEKNEKERNRGVEGRGKWRALQGASATGSKKIIRVKAAGIM